MKVLSLGSICLDILVQSLSEFPQPNHGKQVDQIKILGGGGALNTAIALKRLGVDVYAMGEIGFDYAGDMILNIMQEESINTKLLLRKFEKSTSIVMVIINEEGERSFVCNPGNFIRVNINDYDWDLLTDYDVLLVGSCFILDGLLPDLPQVLQKCREHNVTSIVDTVWPTRPNSQLIIPSLPYMDFFTPSFEEAQLISGRTTVEDIADWCLQQGCKNVIIKMDKNGCYLANDSVRMHIPALKVLLEDSTGAGDCFLAGFIKGLERGYDIVKSTQLANSAGAMCVQKLGAYTGITNFNDLEERYFVQYDNIAV